MMAMKNLCSLSYVNISLEPLALCILLGVSVDANELGKVWEGECLKGVKLVEQARHTWYEIRKGEACRMERFKQRVGLEKESGCVNQNERGMGIWNPALEV